MSIWLWILIGIIALIVVAFAVVGAMFLHAMRHWEQ